MDVEAISSNYFRTLQVPLLQGRDFDSRDRADTQNVIIVNRALADTLFPGENPIGKQIHDRDEWLGRKDWTIIGVVDNIRHGGPDFAEAQFLAYTPSTQRVVGWLVLCGGHSTFGRRIVRSFGLFSSSAKT